MHPLVCLIFLLLEKIWIAEPKETSVQISDSLTDEVIKQDSKTQKY